MRSMFAPPGASDFNETGYSRGDYASQRRRDHESWRDLGMNEQKRRIPGVTWSPDDAIHQLRPRVDEYYGHERTAKICSRFISHTFKSPELSSAEPSLPYSQPPQPSTLARFIAYLLYRTRLPASVTFFSLALLHRLKIRFPSVRGTAGHRLFLAAFIIASKVVCDDTFDNKNWSLACRRVFRLRELSQMEREMLAYLEWNINVSGEDLVHFEREVRKIYSQPPPYSLEVQITLDNGIAKPAAVSSTNPSHTFVPQLPISFAVDGNVPAQFVPSVPSPPRPSHLPLFPSPPTSPISPYLPSYLSGSPTLVLPQYPPPPSSLPTPIDDADVTGSNRDPQSYDIMSVPDLTGLVKKVGAYPFASGGFADIWRGLCPGIDSEDPKEEEVAVKIWRPWASNTSEVSDLARRLTREAHVWSLLSHPNILPFLGVCYDLGGNDLPCLVSPYCKNGSIRKYIEAHPSVNRLKLLIQVALALDFLHSRDPSVVHGDIKSLNILIDDEGNACLSDFGISRILQTSGFTTQNTAGSVRWMAKELFFGLEGRSKKEGDKFGRRISKATDVWSFGMTILEVLSGAIPFSTLAWDAEVILRVSKDEKPDRPDDCALLTDILWALLCRCWDSDPTKRPTVARVHVALNHILRRPKIITDAALMKLLHSTS